MNFKNDKAIYLQLADYFYENILTGKMKPDERIPSVRDLAAETEVNPNTVMRTYKHLQDNNIIYNKRGIGYFISEDALKITHKMKKDEFIKETLPDFFKMLKNLNITFSEIEELYRNYLKENKNENK
ncbi:MAG: GntR family transcriptional regulator [Chlorobi bacterium]|nr:GntR family transcriptional regulator [Chlorobiota bacterium]